MNFEYFEIITDTDKFQSELCTLSSIKRKTEIKILIPSELPKQLFCLPKKKLSIFNQLMRLE